MRTERVLAVAVVLLGLGVAVHGEVVGWRTNWLGQYPAASPPLTWAPQQNVVWSCKLPATSNATPVVSPDGTKIFVTAEPYKLLCISDEGQILWEVDNGVAETLQGEEGERIRAELASAEAKFKQVRELQGQRNRAERILRRNPDDAAAKAEADRLNAQINEIEAGLTKLRDYRPPITHNTNGYASPTPVTDGQRVFAHYGNGVASAFDMAGERLWTRFVEGPQHEWGHSSSPVLVGDTLVVLVRQLHGLDAATGEVKWTAPAQQRWGSPVHIRLGETDAVLTPSGEVVAVADGKILARGVGKLEYATPVVQDGIVYFIENNSRAVQIPVAADGNPQFKQLWSSPVEGDRHYASPIIHDGLIYTISRKENFTVLDAATGQKLYERPMQLGGNMPNSAYPSVTLAGAPGSSLLFISSENGTTAVLRPGREYDEVARNKMPGFRGSPVFVGSRLYLRCFDALYCISDSRTARLP